MLGWLTKMKTLYKVACCIILGMNVKFTHGTDNVASKGDSSCYQNCINAQCVAPDTCRCNEGYYNVEDTRTHYRCKPHCEDCLYGYCSEPGKCVCKDGYEKIDSRCEPVCKPDSVYGHCFGPNSIRCFDGFELNSDTKVCEPICDQTCINSTCVAPNECKCNKGYVHEGSSGYQYTCKPHCDGCSNGVCITPGVCHCKSGYKKKYRYSRCEPICEDKCINGFCISPNVCKCYDGFHKPDSSITNECRPLCSQQCVNSICVAPNECKCIEGHINVENNVFRYTCQPYCADCTNGECTALGDCQCKEGYRKEHARCEPVCSPKCVNGYCDRPNKCKCHKDHQPDLRSPHVCNPICDQKCINSTCVAPNKCDCDDGYVNEENIGTSYSCKPHCDDCSNGDCTAPGVCHCKHGYTMVKSRCEPICSRGCKHGRCVAPDECHCDKGYHADEHGCSLSCIPDCINGLCEPKNQCRCNKGTWKSSAFFCALKCSEYPSDKRCYHSSQIQIHPLKYTLNEENASLELSSNDSISISVPFESLSTTFIAGHTVMDFMCYTDLGVEEDGVADIVCSPAYDSAQCHPFEKGESPIKIKSFIKAVDLVFLYRNGTNLRTAHICQNSNRVFYMKGPSKLNLCFESDRTNDDGTIGDILTSKMTMYSIIVIVVASAVGYVTAKWVSFKNLKSFKRQDRQNHRPLIDADADFEPQSLDYIDISDRLDDLR